MKSELGTDGHRVPAPMHTYCVVIERDALCPRQLRVSIGGCSIINKRIGAVFVSELPWDRLNAAVGRL